MILHISVLSSKLDTAEDAQLSLLDSNCLGNSNLLSSMTLFISKRAGPLCRDLIS